MFNIDVIELLLDKKRNLLSELSANSSIDTRVIDSLEKEIKYLELVTIRYEIAKLLKLDTNAEYMKNDFAGIESVDISFYNLTQEEYDQYRSLVAQIPNAETRRYQIRKEMAELLSFNVEENLEAVPGIENVNPTLKYYQLDSDQLDKFNDLVSEINSLGEESVKKVSLVTEAISVLDSLNISDLDEYRRVKEDSLELVDKLFASIGDYSEVIKLDNVSNYELVYDLSKKYEKLDVQMNLDGFTSLASKMSSMDVTAEEYNGYLNILCSNANKLYEDESKRETVVNTINGIPNDNYILRNDVDKKTNGISNKNIGIKLEELSTIIGILDGGYSTLDENVRNRYYAIVEEVISKNVSNIDNIDQINEAIGKIKNAELNKRLQSKYSGNDTMIFNNPHVSAYSSLVNDRVKAVDAKKSKYASKGEKSKLLSTHYDIKVKELEKEIEKLKDIDAEYNNNKFIEGLDKSYNKKTEKIIQLEKDLKELKELKGQLTSRLRKKIVDKKIQKRTEKVNKLKKAKVKIVGKQKKIMVPKLAFEQRKGTMSRHFDARADVFKEYSEDYKKMAETERQLDGMFSGIRAAFYDFRANRFESKSEFNRSICEKLNNSRVIVSGNHRILTNRNILDRIRNNVQQQAVVQTV